MMKMKGLASNGLGGDEKGIQHLIKFQFFSRILKNVYSLIWGLKTPHNTSESFQ
jgi:hypothetical protein